MNIAKNYSWGDLLHQGIGGEPMSCVKNELTVEWNTTPTPLPCSIIHSHSPRCWSGTAATTRVNQQKFISLLFHELLLCLCKKREDGFCHFPSSCSFPSYFHKRSQIFSKSFGASVKRENEKMYTLRAYRCTASFVANLFPISRQNFFNLNLLPQEQQKTSLSSPHGDIPISEDYYYISSPLKEHFRCLF